MSYRSRRWTLPSCFIGDPPPTSCTAMQNFCTLYTFSSLQQFIIICMQNKNSKFLMKCKMKRKCHAKKHVIYMPFGQTRSVYQLYIDYILLVYFLFIFFRNYLFPLLESKSQSQSKCQDSSGKPKNTPMTWSSKKVPFISFVGRVWGGNEMFSVLLQVPRGLHLSGTGRSFIVVYS